MCFLKPVPAMVGALPRRPFADHSRAGTSTASILAGPAVLRRRSSPRPRSPHCCRCCDEAPIAAVVVPAPFSLSSFFSVPLLLILAHSLACSRTRVLSPSPASLAPSRECSLLGSRVATDRENAWLPAEKGVSGRAAKEGRRAVGPSEGVGQRKAAMRSERCAAASGLHLVAACDAHNWQLVSRRRILKYSIYTMIQALEVRATAGRAAAAGLRPETPGVSDCEKYRTPRTH